MALRLHVSSAGALLGCLGFLVACSSSPGLPAVGGPTAARLELAATEMRFAPSRIAVAAGDVPVVLRNDGQVVHDLRIEDKPTFLLEAGPGKSATATWSLPKGRYQIYCSLPGHRSGGMEGVLEVR
jgi:uncharacterized cupredoxin-like copper-binding protein